MSTDARASARATCTARSAARAPAGRHPRGSDAGGSCRRCASRGRSPTVAAASRRGDPLTQLDPGAVGALFHLVRVADGLEDATQVEAAVRLRRLHRLRRERSERGMQHAALGGEADDEIVRVVAECKQSLDPDLQVVEVVVRHVEPHGEAAGDEVGDRPEVLLRRYDEPDLLGRHAPASRQEARTAVSTLSAASTALSVIRSTLSSCPFTRSTLPPTLLITGSTSRSAPVMNAERRATVPPRRISRYAIDKPMARRKTASASLHRSAQVNAT